MSFFSRSQEFLNSRALELASSTKAVVDQHLIECRDRYIALQALIVKSVAGIIGLLLAIIAYLVAHGGIPLVH